MALNGNEWQSLVPLAEWQADILLFLPLSSRRLRMPLYAIKGASPDVIQCHKSKSFPFSRSNRKTKVFRFNPATQAFPPSRLGIVQTSLPTALGLASVALRASPLRLSRVCKQSLLST